MVVLKNNGPPPSFLAEHFPIGFALNQDLFCGMLQIKSYVEKKRALSNLSNFGHKITKEINCSQAVKILFPFG